MKKSHKILGLAIGVVMLVAAIGGTAVLADTPTPASTPASTSTGTCPNNCTNTDTTTCTNYRDQFFAKLAAALGVDQTKVTDAYNQARSAMIDQAVTDGRITQEQADAMKAKIANGTDCGMDMFGGHGKGGGCKDGTMSGRSGNGAPKGTATGTATPSAAQ